MLHYNQANLRHCSRGFCLLLAFLLCCTLTPRTFAATLQITAAPPQLAAANKAAQPLDTSRLEAAMSQTSVGSGLERLLANLPPEPAPESVPQPEPEPAPQPQPVYVPLDVPTAYNANTGFKSYMDYRKLTNPRTGQYRLQQEAHTDEQGFRIYDGCYMVALGTYYAQGVGERFRITLEGGQSFPAITGDIKSDAHTDSLHQHRQGNIVEFIVDTRAISARCRRLGDMSEAGFAGRILSIEKLN